MHPKRATCRAHAHLVYGTDGHLCHCRDRLLVDSWSYGREVFSWLGNELEWWVRGIYQWIPQTRGARPWLCVVRSEEHTSELQSRFDLVCRLLLEKKKELGEQSASNKDIL